MPENIATSGEVYALYSDARAKVRKRQIGRYDEAAQQLQQVVKMDPNFAPGWATLAVVKNFGVLSQTDAIKTAEADARRAITLAPNLAAGHAALGLALGHGPAAQASLRRALQLDPNDIEAMNWLANSLDNKTQKDEKLQLYSRIAEIEPLWWPAILNKLNILFARGDVDAVKQELARVEQTGNESLASSIKMALMSHTGDLSGVVSLGLPRYRKAPETEQELVAMQLFGALHQLGYSDIADQIFPPPSNYIPYIRTNDPRALDLIEAQHSPVSFFTNGPLPVIGTRVYLINGQGARLARRYRAVASSPEEFEKLVGKFALPDVAPGVALALRAAGDEREARKLLELAELRAAELDASQRDLDITLARIHAVQGKTDQAIGELSAAIRAGWIPPFLPINTDIAMDPPLNEMRKDPRFEQLRQQILGHLRKERAELGPIKLD